VLAFAFAVGVTVAGCGDDDNGSPTSPSPTNQAATGVVANNHGHVATVAAADVSTGRAVTLDIRGTADHAHTLELTNDDVVRLQTRQRVERDSSPNNSHTHRVTFF
jgi:hypothetical protein